MRAVRVSFLLVALPLLTSCSDSQAPTFPAEIQQLTGSTLTAEAGRALAEPLRIRVVDGRGRGVSGTNVVFEIVAGGGSVQPPAASTDLAGIATTTWTLGTEAGEQRVRVSVRGTAAVEFVATAQPGAASRLVVESGAPNSAVVAATLPEALVVRATDSYGNAVARVAIEWTCPEGTLSNRSDVTDDDGLAHATWTLGTRAGIQSATAHIAADSARFTALALPGAAAQITVSHGTLTLLHSMEFEVEANASDAFGNSVHDIAWTAVVPAVAAVTPQPGDPRRALIVTRGVGNAVIRASAGAYTAEAHVHVAAAVGGDYRIVHVGLHPGALNDHADVAGLLPPLSGDPPGLYNRVGIWREGAPARDLELTPHGFPTVTAINNSGSILVHELAPGHLGIAGAGYGTLLRKGAVIPLPGNAKPHDLNEANVIVGTLPVMTPGSFNTWYYGFLWSEGKTTRIGHPTVTDWNDRRSATYPVSINDRGQVAVNLVPEGSAGTAAYVWQAGEYTPIPDPGSCNSWRAVRVVDEGQVLVNCARTDGTVASFVWHGDAAFTSLGPVATAHDMNDRGEVVGVGTGGLYLWRNGQVTRIVETVQATAMINNRSQILLTTPWAPYLLTPRR